MISLLLSGCGVWADKRTAGNDSRNTNSANKNLLRYIRRNLLSRLLPQSTLLVSTAEPRNRQLQDVSTSFQLGDGHELTRAMCFANIARSNDHRLTAERHHLCCFGAESDCSGCDARCFFHQ